MGDNFGCTRMIQIVKFCFLGLFSLQFTQCYVVLQLRNVSLPCQRECAEIHNLSVDLQLEILDLHIQEERNIQLRNIRKSSVLRVIIFYH